MNEVTVLSTVGELTGRAVGTGVLLARRAVVATGRTATGLGVAAGRASARAAADAVRARRRVVEQAGAISLPEVRVPAVRVPDVSELRRELAAAIAPTRRRRWPWVVLVVGALTGAALLAAVRRPVAAPPAPAPPRVQDVARSAPVDPESANPAVTDPAVTDPSVTD